MTQKSWTPCAIQWSDQEDSKVPKSTFESRLQLSVPISKLYASESNRHSRPSVQNPVSEDFTSLDWSYLWRVMSRNQAQASSSRR